MSSFISPSGLTYLWSKIKAWVNEQGFLTQHQDISGKADKATTLSGYGITDAKIANGVITLGSNTITPLTSFTETDPTVPSWAKQSSKPTYTASEVGALPDTTVIPTESTVSGWGFTKNAGTITGINVAGVSKGTSGVVDVGVSEVNHGTSDTTFTLTPNVMHIWGTVSSLTLSLPTDSNSYLDEFMFTFTSGSTATTLSLPSTVKWVQDIEVETNKTYQVSIINNLAGWLTNGMPSGGGSGGGGENNVIESISVNGVEQTVSSKNVNITVPTKVSDLTNDSGFISSYTETDPIFAASAAYGISSSDITNWNSKTSNVGTITGINMNGASKGTSGVVDLGTVITAHQDISGKADKSTTTTAGTYKSVTVNASGIVTGGTNPTTLAGYGITDAYTKTESDENYWTLQGGTDLNPSSTNTVDLNTITEYGNYYCMYGTGYANYVTNKPNDLLYLAFTLKVYNPAGSRENYITQCFQFYHQCELYTRYSTNGGSTWNSWRLVQLDFTNLTALKNVYTGSSAPSSSTGSNGDIYIQY